MQCNEKSIKNVLDDHVANYIIKDPVHETDLIF